MHICEYISDMECDRSAAVIIIDLSASNLHIKYCYILFQTQQEGGGNAVLFKRWKAFLLSLYTEILETNNFLGHPTVAKHLVQACMYFLTLWHK